MAEIAPFKAVMYDSVKAGALVNLVAPPYDVISPAEQQALYAASPFNCIRIILNRGDGPGGDPYAGAAGALRQWLESGALKEDAAPSLYLYQQEFTHPVTGARLTRGGLFCALRLEPYSAGVVLPHEETRTKAREDRMSLMRATRCNPEPIFGLYEDEDAYLKRVLDQAAVESERLLRVEVDGDEHRVLRIASPEAIGLIQRALAPKRIWIADGHHRYETALDYRDERRAAEGGPSESRAYDYLLIVLSAFNDPGMVVLPTHRLVRNVAPARMEQLLLQLERYFEVQPSGAERLAGEMLAQPGMHRFGLMTADGAWVLTLRDESVMDTAAEGESVHWKRLDVAILQALALDRSLGIPAASLASTPDVAYTRDAREALDRVRSGEFQAAFLLNDPTADEVRRVASAGDKMPPKSTFFYPKLWSGLLMRLLD